MGPYWSRVTSAYHMLGGYEEELEQARRAWISVQQPDSTEDTILGGSIVDLVNNRTGHCCYERAKPHLGYGSYLLPVL